MGKKSLVVTVVIIMAGFFIAGLAAAANHEASADKGKALFNDPKLGTTGKSCNDCHKDGKGMEKAAGKKDLEDTVNTCITNALKGKELDEKSVEMQSLVKYINSFSGKKKKAPVGC
jgi:cytochrome c peroxidase